MKKVSIISAIIGFILFFAVGIGIGARISEPKQEKDIEYCTKCPMCGERVKLNPIGDDWYIECQNFDCGLQTGYFEDKEELIEKWNEMCGVEE